MSKIQLIYGLPAVLLCAGFAVPARADFVGISDPNASYLAATTKLDVTGNEFDSVASLSDASQTATFYIAPIPFPTALTIYDVNSGWFGWSSPPDSESDTPRVLGTTSQLEITLDAPSLVFGFEAEPNLFGVQSIVVDFFGGGVLRGSITRAVEGDSGARLFAGYSSLGIDDIQISSTDDFGIAQLRYGNTNPIPEPNSALLLALVALVIFWYGSRQLAASRSVNHGK
jgi:hypothetical protein